MARKHLLDSLMGAPETKSLGKPPETPSPAPRYAKGAIGAVSKSIAELKSRSVVDLDPFSIKAGGLADRRRGAGAGPRASARFGRCRLLGS